MDAGFLDVLSDAASWFVTNLAIATWVIAGWLMLAQDANQREWMEAHQKEGFYWRDKLAGIMNEHGETNEFNVDFHDQRAARMRVQSWSERLTRLFDPQEVFAYDPVKVPDIPHDSDLDE